MTLVIIINVIIEFSELVSVVFSVLFPHQDTVLPSSEGSEVWQVQIIVYAMLVKTVIFYLKIEYVLHCQDYVTWFDRRSFQLKLPNPCRNKSEKILENFSKAQPHWKMKKIQNCNFLALSPQVLYSITRMWLK